MKRKTLDRYVFSGIGDVTIELDRMEFGDPKKEAVFFQQLLYDNLPEGTYDELVRLMMEVN